MNEQTSTPEDSYDDVDDSLSFSSSPEQGADDATVEASEEPAAVESVDADPAEDVAPDEAPADDSAEEPVEGEPAESTDVEDADEDAAASEGSEEPEEEDPVAVLKRHLRSAPGDWYVIHSYSGHENRVRTQLTTRIETQDMEEYIFQVEVPMEDATEIKNGQKKIVRRVRIPGYVYVRMEMTEGSWRVVRDTPGVTGFVGNATDPTPLSFDEIFSVLAPSAGLPEKKRSSSSSAKAQAAQKMPDFQVGESVTVMDGPFETMPASVSYTHLTLPTNSLV